MFADGPGSWGQVEVSALFLLLLLILPRFSGSPVASAFVSWVAAIRDLIFAVRTAAPCAEPAGPHCV